jgi:hypothetical protein
MSKPEHIEGRSGPGPTSNRVLLEYLLAALLGLTAASIVLWQLESLDSTFASVGA